MDVEKFEGSQKLKNLAEQLRLNRNPIEDHRIPNPGQVVPQEEELTSERLKNPAALQPEKVKSNRAAVLICLFEGEEGDLRVILTKRSSRLSSHSGENILMLSIMILILKLKMKRINWEFHYVFVGEVALPGGKVEEGDANYAETALREAEEEIGLDPSLVNVVTFLEPFTYKVMND